MNWRGKINQLCVSITRNLSTVQLFFIIVDIHLQVSFVSFYLNALPAITSLSFQVYGSLRVFRSVEQQCFGVQAAKIPVGQLYRYFVATFYAAYLKRALLSRRYRSPIEKFLSASSSSRYYLYHIRLLREMRVRFVLQ